MEVPEGWKVAWVIFSYYGGKVYSSWFPGDMPTQYVDDALSVSEIWSYLSMATILSDGWEPYALENLPTGEQITHFKKQFVYHPNLYLEKEEEEEESDA